MLSTTEKFPTLNLEKYFSCMIHPNVDIKHAYVFLIVRGIETYGCVCMNMNIPKFS